MGKGSDYEMPVPAGQKNETLMVKLKSGETIYIRASFASSTPEFRHLTNRAALEKVQNMLAASFGAETLVEKPRIIILA